VFTCYKEITWLPNANHNNYHCLVVRPQADILCVDSAPHLCHLIFIYNILLNAIKMVTVKSHGMFYLPREHTNENNWQRSLRTEQPFSAYYPITHRLGQRHLIIDNWKESSWMAKGVDPILFCSVWFCEKQTVMT
jgi:hypothetical protein